MTPDEIIEMCARKASELLDRSGHECLGPRCLCPVDESTRVATAIRALKAKFKDNQNV
jgi:hypothetical protein